MPEGMLIGWLAILALAVAWSASDGDEVLIAAARSGDQKAFDQLVARYFRRVEGFVRRKLGGWPDDDRKDVVQEVFVNAFKGIHSVRDPSAYLGWLCEVAVRVSNNFVRRNRRRLEATPLASSDEDAEEPTARLPDVDPAAQPEVVAVENERTRRIHAALDRLSPDHRMVIILHELLELTYEEIAHELGLPVGTVKSRVNRALKALRDDQQLRCDLR